MYVLNNSNPIYEYKKKRAYAKRSKKTWRGSIAKKSKNASNNNDDGIVKHIVESTKSYGDTTVKSHGFSVFEFQDEFKNCLNKILTSDSNKSEYERKVQRFVIFCCRNELYYLYSRRLLSELRETNLWTKLDYALSNIGNKLDEYT
eukprot:72618_1